MFKGMSKDNRTSTRGVGEPPSPPLSESQDVQYGHRRLQHHNAATQYQPTPHAYGSGMNTFTSNFTSSEQQRVSIGQHEESRYRNAFDGSQMGYEYVRNNLEIYQVCELRSDRTNMVIRCTMTMQAAYEATASL